MPIPQQASRTLRWRLLPPARSADLPSPFGSGRKGNGQGRLTGARRTLMNQRLLAAVLPSPRRTAPPGCHLGPAFHTKTEPRANTEARSERAKVYGQEQLTQAPRSLPPASFGIATRVSRLPQRRVLGCPDRHDRACSAAGPLPSVDASGALDDAARRCHCSQQQNQRALASAFVFGVVRLAARLPALQRPRRGRRWARPGTAAGPGVS